MKYFLVKKDHHWCSQNGAECYTDSTWRMPGIFCPAHPRIPTYVDGYSYPAADFAQDSLLKRALYWGLEQSESEMDWQEQWKQPQKWHELKAKVVSALPYEVPILSGTSLGPITARIVGKPADFHHSLLGGHILLSATALEKLRQERIEGLFAVPCKVQSKRARELYYELQIEHQTELAVPLSVSDLKLHKQAGYPLKCAQCGKEFGALPKRVILRGQTIPDNAHLFRLKNRPTDVICSEAFAQAVTKLQLTNIQFVPVRTDDSEKKHGLAQARPSRPELWSGCLKTSPSAKAKKKRIARQTMPRVLSLSAAIGEAGLGQYRDQLLELARPSLRFIANPENNLPMGQSRLGGLPDLPKGVPWPGSSDAPLDFLIQIDLADVRHHLSTTALPKSGLLTFFYDSENCPWGVQPEDKKGWRVFFHDEPASQLVRCSRASWLSENSVLPSCRLEFAKVDSLPAPDSAALKPLKFSEHQGDSYRKMLNALRWPRGKEVAVHRLLGFPDAVQGDMTVSCAMASAGIEAYRRPDMRDSKERSLAKSAQDWTLLLQIDSEARLGLEWADAGRLFYWVRKADLAAKNFDRSWVILQTH